VDAAVDADRLFDEALAAAKAMAALPPAAFAHTKKQLRAPAEARMREGRERFDAAIHDYWGAPATLAAIRDYVQRTLKK
jgi:enoyl-CoA hydratase